MAPPPAILIEELSFSYDGHPLLADVNLHISEGALVAIVGPNGGGKTTLLRLLLGFLKPTTGCISLFGHPPQSARSHIAYVPQIMQYDRHFPISLLELVLMGRLRNTPWWGRYAKRDLEVARSALQSVGLEGRERTPFSQLSGGQAQRALIARALAAEPRLLLLDEPTANVDVNAESEIHAVLRALKGSMTILMVTHNLKVALELASQIFCVQRTVYPLPPEEICTHFGIGLYHPIKETLKRAP